MTDALRTLQAEVGAWQRDRWPDDVADRLVVVVKAAKVAEEVGELCAAALKSLPGDGRLTASDVEAEAGDVLVTLVGLADLAGFDLLEVALRRWAEVKTRDYAAAAVEEFEPDDHLGPIDPDDPGTVCPVPGCSTPGSHVHKPFELAAARGLLTAEHTATHWSGDDWRVFLQSREILPGSALVAVRTYAEGRGWAPPYALDAVRGRPQLAAVLLELAGVAA